MLMMLLGPLIGQGTVWMKHAGSADDHCMTMQNDSYRLQGAHLEHLLDACGYCSLFFHTPSIPNAHYHNWSATLQALWAVDRLEEVNIRLQNPVESLRYNKLMCWPFGSGRQHALDRCFRDIG
ncbi:DUF2946 domain-containing protein [Pseudomonas sp. P7]|nr:DUF2946 domain-containing protein [Pseudomonas sivasensis]MCK6191147.1 DUF2946 domain-containing protein [Pseudomonas sp. EYE_354]